MGGGVRAAHPATWGIGGQWKPLYHGSLYLLAHFSLGVGVWHWVYPLQCEGVWKGRGAHWALAIVSTAPASPAKPGPCHQQPCVLSASIRSAGPKTQPLNPASKPPVALSTKPLLLTMHITNPVPNRHPCDA